MSYKIVIVIFTIISFILIRNSQANAATYGGTYADLTIPPGPHSINNDVNITGALIIQQGASLVFTGNWRFTVNGGTVAINGTSAAPVSFSGNHRFIEFNNGTSGTVTYCNVSDANAGFSINNSSVNITRCSITNTSTGIIITNCSPTITYCDINANSTGIFVQHNVLLPSPIVSLCSITGSTNDIMASDFFIANKRFNFELNYFPGGVSTFTLGVDTIDTAPELSNNPFTTDNLNNPATPVIIQGNTGSVHFPHNLEGAFGVNNRYYRLDGGNLTLDGPTANVTLGFSSTGAIVGGSILGVNGPFNINVINGASLTMYGSSTTHRSIATSFTDASGGAGAVSQWNGIIVDNTSQVSANFARISCAASGISTNASTVTLNRTLFSLNTTGLYCTGTANPVLITANFNNDNTFYIQSDSTVTIDAEGCYFDGAIPVTANFGGTGVIDYEPWSTNADGTAINSLPPVSPNLITPPNNGNLPAAPTQYIFSGYDIGMYGDHPVEHQIRLATNNLLTAIVFNITNPPTVNGQITYPTTNMLEGPGPTYYWQVRSRDPYGTNTWGAWSTTYNFVIQGPAITLNITANVSNAGAGDNVNYTVSFNNTGGPALNTKVVNILPADLFFNNTNGSAGINIPANAVSATFSVYTDNAGTPPPVGRAILTGLLGAGVQMFNWNAPPGGALAIPLSAANAVQVRRVEVEMAVVTTNAQGFIYYRTNVR